MPSQIVARLCSQPLQASRTNCLTVELLSLLRVIQDIFLIGPEEWNMMITRHANSYPSRNIHAVRRKYNALLRICVPTGDPNYLEEVKMPKRIKYFIDQRTSLGGGDKSFELKTGRFTDLS